MLRRLLPAAVAGLIASPTACSPSSTLRSTPIEEDAGNVDASAVDQDADLGPPVAFTASEVQDVFNLKCIRCHAGSDVLDLRKFEAATIGVAPDATDVRAKCGSSKQKLIIAPGDREASLLWHKVTATQDCGDSMPIPLRGINLTPRELESLGLYIDSLR